MRSGLISGVPFENEIVQAVVSVTYGQLNGRLTSFTLIDIHPTFTLVVLFVEP